MARNEGDAYVAHMAGVTGTMMSVAAANPAGTIAFVVLLTIVSLVARAVIFLRETSDTWLPWVGLSLPFLLLWMAHAFVWGPYMRAKPRKRLGWGLLMASIGITVAVTGPGQKTVSDLTGRDLRKRSEFAAMPVAYGQGWGMARFLPDAARIERGDRRPSGKPGLSRLPPGKNLSDKCRRYLRDAGAVRACEGMAARLASGYGAARRDPFLE